MTGILEKLSEYKKATMLSVVLGIMMSLAAMAGAEGPDTETVAAMTSAFEGIKSTALTALGSIAGIAILLFGAIYAWRYGKKVFSIIAK